MRCSINTHKPIVDCPKLDVIDTFMEMTKHQPFDWSFGKFGSYPMFVCPIAKWRLGDDVWFNITLIGQNQFWLIVDKFTMVFLDLKDKVLFNKTSRGVGVTHMEEALVP
jgi:hypothetical protein